MMKENTNTSDALKISDEHRIDAIRNLRNNLIKDFLEEQTLQAYFKGQHNRNLNAIRVEFMRKELRDLLMSLVRKSNPIY